MLVCEWFSMLALVSKHVDNYAYMYEFVCVTFNFLLVGQSCTKIETLGRWHWAVKLRTHTPRAWYRLVQHTQLSEALVEQL